MNLDELNRRIKRAIPEAMIVKTQLQLCPEIKLYLLNPSNMKRPFSTSEVRSIQSETPYWALCWASGRALAQHILNNRLDFKNKSVLDFGSGSGVAAIASAMAGAREVIACDIDMDALQAIKANAELNHQSIQTCRTLDEISMTIDILLAADVLYDRENYHFLEKFLDLAPEVLIADSRLKTIDIPSYRKIDQITTVTLPDLNESDEFNHVKIYRAAP